jgi:RNA polymerase sigma factor (sigma-70 family)
VTSPRIDELVRPLTPQVIGALTRRYGMFDLCEDAVQEALLDAAMQWPHRGVPDSPRAWLITVASRRLTDLVRSDSSRRRREESQFAANREEQAPPADEPPGLDRDDSLTLLFLCCHPALSAPSQIALTLRGVGGLTTDEIASAHLVPTATMGQRISRAKQRLREIDAPFAMPTPQDLPNRLDAVLHVLYLIFNEGYTASSGEMVIRADLTTEAIRLTRELHRQLPNDGEVTGLLALMLLTEARRPARVAQDGSLIPLADQDRTRWTKPLITEGTTLISGALTTTELGPYQLQAAIAAIHDEAEAVASTDWSQILALYSLLETVAPNPMVTLNKAIAVAEVQGPQAGLNLLESLKEDPRVANHHRLPAVQAHLQEQAGNKTEAKRLFEAAAEKAPNHQERKYLQRKAEAL